MGALTDHQRIRKARDQRGRCFYCSLPLRDDMTWEHLVARAHGGTNKDSNLAIAHAVCNSMVGTLDVRVKYALAEIGHRIGSDAFFILVSRMKPLANASRGPDVKRRRRPKRPPPPVHRENVLQLVRQLPDDIVAESPYLPAVAA